MNFKQEIWNNIPEKPVARTSQNFYRTLNISYGRYWEGNFLEHPVAKLNQLSLVNNSAEHQIIGSDQIEIDLR